MRHGTTERNGVESECEKRGPALVCIIQGADKGKRKGSEDLGFFWC